MNLTQFDVCTAFLYGNLEEEVYMKQPVGFEDGTNRVCRLRKSLYGLKQAPRCWNTRFSDVMKKLGMTRSESDPCLFIQKEAENLLLLALYVDDGLLASTDENMKDNFLNKLKQEFKITVKPASYFLGLEIEKKGDVIQVSQDSYTKNLLKRFGMENCKPVSSPIVKEISGESGKVLSETSTFSYREAVGALMYLMTGTRPDIAYAVSIVSRNLSNPVDQDYKRVKRIMRYLKGTINTKLQYDKKEMDLIGYSDADYGGDERTGRSTSGVLCTHAGGAIIWISHRQTSVAISTTEAEIVAASEATKELIWLKRLFKETIGLSTVPKLYVDNEAARKLAQNPEYHRRTKHIQTRHFFVREKFLEGSIDIQRISTEEQVADIMTKPLFGPRINKLRSDMGLQVIK